MEKAKLPITRKHGRHLRVPVLPDEENDIKHRARTAGLSVAAYLRHAGLGLPVQSLVDKDHILELARINADLGRLGGLLKLWLVQDKRVRHFDQRQLVTLVRHLRETQKAMLDVVQRL